MEIGSRRTRQRHAILEAVRATKSHPDVQWVYEQVRQDMPRVSLGTVYRNLDLLARSGIILRIPTIDGLARYDADTSSHSHVACRLCGRIDDIDIELPMQSFRDAAAEVGFEDVSAIIEIYGVCPDCQSQKQQKSVA